MAKILSENKVKQLIGLIERGKITIESIKDADYRNAVKAELAA